jgi:glycosyltransferase involved in cell wall biosynthesis
MYINISVRIIYWGMEDRNISSQPSEKSESLKLELVSSADGFFAYTDGVKSYLTSKGVSEDKIYVLNNTIDILHHLGLCEKSYPLREIIRERYNLSNEQVLLFVGRLIKNKKVDFLLEAFSHIQDADHNFHLILVGGGKFDPTSINMEGITYLDALPDDELAGICYLIFVFQQVI